MILSNENIHILVVDDEEIVVSLIKDAFEEEGYNFETASNGFDALKILENFPVNLLITDIRMSPVDGIELAEKTRDKFPDASVIFITGYANLNSAKDAIKYGAVDYILKPFELTEIRQSVTKAIDKIKKEASKKNSINQLESLSDLNQMLYESGDRESLINISLKFSTLHLESTHGTVFLWDNDKNNLQIVSLKDGKYFQQSITDQTLINELKKYKFDIRIEPHFITSKDNELFTDFIIKICQSKDIVNCEKLGTDFQFVFIPIQRVDKFYGFILVKIPLNESVIKESDLQLLSITTSQLALSLENLSLLEETRKAYSKLQELQDETIQLEKMAARGEISAEVGHELNNFLGVVAGNLSLLDLNIHRKNYDKLEKYLTAMNDNIQKIKKFTRNLMDLKPIASDKKNILFENLLMEVIDYLKPQKRFEGVTIVHKKSKAAILFEADSTHIQQVLYNLFNNAADASLGCKKREIIVATNINEIEKCFEFIIKDTGKGIEPELLKKAFNEKFTTKEDGHGFGLLVCKRIIENHNGHFSVNSIPEEGTTISIVFPLAVTEHLIPV